MAAYANELRSPVCPPRVMPDPRLLQRVRGEYREMPSLQLSVVQAMRLWSLDRLTCVSVMDTLVADGFLSVDAQGRYMRRHCGY